MFKCNKCSELKPLLEFRKNPTYRDGIRPICIPCLNADNLKYREQNKDKIKLRKATRYSHFKEEISKRNKKYTEKNQEKIKTYRKEYYLRNKEKINSRSRLHYKENKEQYMINGKRYESKNKESRRKYYNNYVSSRRDSDPVYRLKTNVRSLIRTVFRNKGYQKKSKTEKILGCELSFLISHLKETFKSRYGRDFTKEDRVEIDHILPMALATTEEEVLKFNHFSNLQLLTRMDNLRKGDSLQV